MALGGDTVNIHSSIPGTPSRYHHGRLRESLIDAGVTLARADGPAGVGLRAASRLAGVSHNAAYRHFTDLDALLAAVGERCMRELALLMEARIAAVRTRRPAEASWDRLQAIGRAYVEFATTETGWFRTAFAAYERLPDPSGEPGRSHPEPGVEAATAASAAGAGDSGLSPYELLNRCLDELVAVGEIPTERRPGLEYAAWAAVHGYATLLVDGPLRTLEPPEREHGLTIVLDVVARGL